MEELRSTSICLKFFRAPRDRAGLLERGELDAIDRGGAALIDEAVGQAKAAPPPVAADLLTDVYSDLLKGNAIHEQEISSARR